MTNLFPFPKFSPEYNNWVQEYGSDKVNDVYNQLDEMESWFPEMENQQLILYVGHYNHFDTLVQSRDYITSNFPDFADNKFMFLVVSAMSYNELLSRGYDSEKAILDEFYQITGYPRIVEREDESVDEDFGNEQDSDAEWDALPWYKKAYYGFIGIGIIFAVIKFAFWLYELIF
jgi:hypothetical protein